MFGKIKGHESILSRLRKEVAAENFDGVHIFSGPVSSGKFQIARNIGRYLTCTGLVEDTCRCENCRLFPNVPDYTEVFKGSGTITVEDITGLIEFLSLVPYRGRKKVAVIDNAHNMNISAANRLLIAFEELAVDCSVILVTDKPECLLPTVVSRSYVWEFNRLGSEEISDILKELGHPYKKLKDMERVIPFLAGDVLTDFPVYYRYYEKIPEFLKGMTGKREDNLLAALKEIEGAEELLFFVEMLVVYLNDMLKVRYGCYNQVLCVNNFSTVEELSVMFKEDICVFMITRLKNMLQSMDKNLNLKMIHFIAPVISWGYYFIHRETEREEKK